MEMEELMWPLQKKENLYLHLNFGSETWHDNLRDPQLLIEREFYSQFDLTIRIVRAVENAYYEATNLASRFVTTTIFWPPNKGIRLLNYTEFCLRTTMTPG